MAIKSKRWHRARPRMGVKGERHPNAKITDRAATRERGLAKRARAHNDGTLPIGWTSARAARYRMSRQAYEQMLYGDHYRHLPGALARGRTTRQRGK